MVPTLSQVVVMAVVVGVVSLTITRSSLFEKLRDWIDDYSEFLADLFSCPYCMSHWIALGLVVLYRPLLIDSGRLWLDLGVSWFTLTGLGAAVAGGIMKLYSGEE